MILKTMKFQQALYKYRNTQELVFFKEENALVSQKTPLESDLNMKSKSEIRK